MFRLTLLGPFRAQVDGQSEPLRLPTQKAVALLAYLALRDESRVSRDSLAALLWNDVPVQQGRHSLRQELMHIRAALGANADTYLEADRNTVDLHFERIQVDASRLVDLVASHTFESMRDACTLYRGELLAGLKIRERAFDAWLVKKRHELRQLAVNAHECHFDELTRRGKTIDARQAALHLVHLDPDHEWVHRRLTTAGEDSDESVDADPQHRIRTNMVNASVDEPENVLSALTCSTVRHIDATDPDTSERADTSERE